jgi:hypothetical protein
MIGPPGLGRELAAVEMAVLAVCRGADSAWSQGGCADRVRAGVHPDVDAVLPAGAKGIIKVDRVRDIVDSVRGRPFEGERRVWILDGVEGKHLEAAAANAFLKTLEEPPAHAFLILLAANPMAVLPTIRSRCQQLSLPGTVAVAKRLADESLPPELVASVVGDEVADATDMVRTALQAGLDGRPRQLMRLPHGIANGVPPFQLVAATAVQMASDHGDQGPSEGLVRLAADLLAVERRTRALNLNGKSQMVSSLMRWYRGCGE